MVMARLMIGLIMSVAMVATDAASPAAPVKLIIDTDMGFDVDDVRWITAEPSFTVNAAFHSRPECSFPRVALWRSHARSAACPAPCSRHSWRAG